MIADTPPSVETVVVRGAVLPPSPADAAFSIIHLNAARIQTAARLDEALSDVPGVSLFRRTSSLAANPTSQGISLRGIAGSGASRALVTLDGVPQNDPFGGWVIWTRLPVQDIGAVSIVRGAGAGPYGAGALTGVIALSESASPVGYWTADAAVGSLGQASGAVTETFRAGAGALFVTAAGGHSDGWIPVQAARGAADRRLSLSDWSLSARYQLQSGPITQAWRASLYEERRGAGLALAESRARGATLSYSLAKPPAGGAAGWRGQIWLAGSDLFNTSVSVASNRNSTSLSNDQYETPALGYGANAAARWQSAQTTLEIGLDGRGAVGEDRETFRPIAGVLTKRRLAGGQTATGGAYADATWQTGRLLLVAGARVDEWATFDAHRREFLTSTGAKSLALSPVNRDGVLPSGRAAARLDLGAGQWLRVAGYTGFRAPTLNELFRPFRVGNNITQANAALTPERLYGAEIGAGGDATDIHWSATAFYNRLDNPVTNVTIARGPFTDPVEGLIPAGGALLQRRNIGFVTAYGLEAEAAADISTSLSARAAISWTHARADGGVTAPQITSKIPTETPGISMTAGLTWRALRRLKLGAAVGYEGQRFDDDLNTLRLAPAATVDLRAEWQARENMQIFLAVENVGGVDLATGETASGVFSYGPPRTVLIGVKVRGRR